MQPCCWGPLLQQLVQALPFLAIFLLACKRLFGLLRQTVPPLTKARFARSKPCPEATANEKISPLISGPGAVSTPETKPCCCYTKTELKQG